jgi:hypothetical protein
MGSGLCEKCRLGMRNVACAVAYEMASSSQRFSRSDGTPLSFLVHSSMQIMIINMTLLGSRIDLVM